MPRPAIRLGDLDQLKIAVTFLGPLAEIAPAGLDFSRFAIVVREADDGPRVGGALPNTQVFSHEIQQYRHTLCTNAQMGALEPHTLFRQTVEKAVEAGHRWPSYGAPTPPDLAWVHDDEFGRTLLEQVRQALAGEAELAGKAAPGAPTARAVEGVAVCLYRRGMLTCRVAWGPGDPSELAGAAARRLVADAAASVVQALTADDGAVVLTVLYDREELRADPGYVATKVRVGLDALAVVSPDQIEPTVLLPAAGVYNNWSKADLVNVLSRCVRGGGHRFRSYRAASWVGFDNRVHRVEFGFPVRPPGNRPDLTEPDLIGPDLIGPDLYTGAGGVHAAQPFTGRRAGLSRQRGHW